MFAALDLPAPVRDALGAFGRAAAADDFALRAVGDDALHVTLAFLGHRPLEDIDPAREAVRGAAGPVPELALGDALWLAPRPPPPPPLEGAHALPLLPRRRAGALRGAGAGRPLAPRRAAECRGQAGRTTETIVRPGGSATAKRATRRWSGSACSTAPGGRAPRSGGQDDGDDRAAAWAVGHREAPPQRPAAVP